MAYHLTHPESKQEIEVEADRVPMYKTQGWQTKAETRKAQAEKSEPNAEN